MSFAAQGGTDLGGLSFQFGNFGLNNAGPDLGTVFASSGLGSAFEQSAAPSGQLPESQHSGAASVASESYRSAYSQPQSSLAQVSAQPQQAQQHRAYNAFTSPAVQPQVACTS